MSQALGGQWELRMRRAGSELENGIKHAPSFTNMAKGLTAWLLLIVVIRWTEECSHAPAPQQSSSQGQPHYTGTLVSRGTLLSSTEAPAPLRTPAMSYFTGTAPQGPQCHALMAAPS